MQQLRRWWISFRVVMTMSKQVATAVEVTISCPACRDGATTQQAIYRYALAYLCAECREWWIEADNRAHKGGVCPHHPNACVLDRSGCAVEVDTRMTRLGGARS